jgi:triosephosphate isomerase
MRRPLVAGNWKMNLDRAGAVALAHGVSSAAHSSVDVLICPPYVYLEAVRAAAAEGVMIGAQDLYYETSGAYTGEVSASMLTDIGCKYVIIGHSERRHTISHLEDDRMLNLKVKAARSAGLIPILCVGETLTERKSGNTLDALSYQTQAGLIDVDVEQTEDLVIAYEPVWAIGTGETATPQQAQEAHAHIRGVLRIRFGELADDIRILYGGSVKPDNAAELFSQHDVDGGLIGGASLKAESFGAIVAAGVAQAGGA